uniref:Uncharacterized protein n=1 Tax=Ditylenchus dipsaci TaxID=166011 RepID=A0A915DN03_9BILA
MDRNTTIVIIVLILVFAAVLVLSLLRGFSCGLNKVNKPGKTKSQIHLNAPSNGQTGTKSSSSVSLNSVAVSKPNTQLKPKKTAVRSVHRPMTSHYRTPLTCRSSVSSGSSSVKVSNIEEAGQKENDEGKSTY